MDRRAVIVFFALSALALCAVTAPSAFAATRFFTCAESGTKEFSDAHCLTKGELKKYGHVLITAPTEISVTNARTASSTTAAAPFKIKGSISGVETELVCTNTAGMGSVETNTEAGGVGSGVIELSGCTVTRPAGKSCVVKEGVITFKKLRITAETTTVKFAPFEGEELGTFTVEKCSVPPLNNTFPVKGSFKMTPSGATYTSTHAGITTQGTVTCGGQVCGFDAAFTFAMKTPVADGEAITVT